jgi:hypothetical protein
MQVQLLEEEKVKRSFVAFSFKVDVQDEDELLELYHRFNLFVGKLTRLYDDGIPPKWHFRTEKCREVNKILENKLVEFGIEP